MRAEFEEVIRLQQQFSSKATPAMTRRGELIRRAIPAELATVYGRLSKALGPYGDDLRIVGRDGLTNKTYVPWVRFFSASQSPTAQRGWYCVYLFEATGRGVYLALSHGSTTFDGGQFVPRPAAEVAALVEWARLQLSDAISADPQLGEPMVLNGRELSDAYERSTAIAKWYAFDAIPNDEALFNDTQRFAELLRRIYDADRDGRAPHTRPPEVIAVEDTIAARPERRGGQGFGLTTAERRAVEMHAMAIAKQHLVGEKWRVRDVSMDKPYDFDCRKGNDELIVEVKGTTSPGEQVVLTSGEVRAQRLSYPNNALLIVHSILLDRDSPEPSASGGVLQVISPWLIDDDDLSAIAYSYRMQRNT